MTVFETTEEARQTVTPKEAAYLVGRAVAISARFDTPLVTRTEGGATIRFVFMEGSPLAEALDLLICGDVRDDLDFDQWAYPEDDA